MSARLQQIEKLIAAIWQRELELTDVEFDAYDSGDWTLYNQTIYMLEKAHYGLISALPDDDTTPEWDIYFNVVTRNDTGN